MGKWIKSCSPPLDSQLSGGVPLKWLVITGVKFMTIYHVVLSPGSQIVEAHSLEGHAEANHICFKHIHMFHT